MYLSHASGESKRPGKVLAMFALALPALLGMMAIVIDGAMGLSFHRQLQNAADNAAKAAALRLFQDWHLPQAQREANAAQVATAFIQTHHGYARNSPRVTFGAAMREPVYSDATQWDYYVKVALSHTVDTWFAHILGASTTTVYVEAVAGFEHHFDRNDPSRWPEYREGVIALDPRATTANTGIVMGTGSQLSVDGSVVVNARGRGFDQYQADVDYGFPSQALTLQNGALLSARYLQVRGGVQNTARIRKFNPNDPHLLFGRAGIVPDPLGTNRKPFRYLPIPVGNIPPFLEIEIRPGESRTLDPAIYSDIHVRDGGEVTFRRGVYVLRPPGYLQAYGLRIDGGARVRATGPVMFYFATDRYDADPARPGRYDQEDGAVNYIYDEERLPAPSTPSLALAVLDINLTGTQIQLQGLDTNDVNWPNILFFQRRHSEGITGPLLEPYNDPTQRFRIRGNLGNNQYLRGTIYAKWGTLRLGGTAVHSGTQFVVGNVLLENDADITVRNPPANRHTARKTFLVQ